MKTIYLTAKRDMHRIKKNDVFKVRISANSYTNEKLYDMKVGSINVLAPANSLFWDNFKKTPKRHNEYLCLTDEIPGFTKGKVYKTKYKETVPQVPPSSWFKDKFETKHLKNIHIDVVKGDEPQSWKILNLYKKPFQQNWFKLIEPNY